MSNKKVYKKVGFKTCERKIKLVTEKFTFYRLSSILYDLRNFSDAFLMNFIHVIVLKSWGERGEN